MLFWFVDPNEDCRKVTHFATAGHEYIGPVSKLTKPFLCSQIRTILGHVQQRRSRTGFHGNECIMCIILARRHCTRRGVSLDWEIMILKANI